MNKKEVMDVIVAGEKTRKGVIVDEITVAAKKNIVFPNDKRYHLDGNLTAAIWLTIRNVFKQQKTRRCFP